MRLWRRLADGEFDARRASGEGLPGGPPTSILSSCSGTRPTLLDDRELRRSFGGGIGLGDDMSEATVLSVRTQMFGAST